MVLDALKKQAEQMLTGEGPPQLLRVMSLHNKNYYNLIQEKLKHKAAVCSAEIPDYCEFTLFTMGKFIRHLLQMPDDILAIPNIDNVKAIQKVVKQFTISFNSDVRLYIVHNKDPDPSIVKSIKMFSTILEGGELFRAANPDFPFVSHPVKFISLATFQKLNTISQEEGENLLKEKLHLTPDAEEKEIRHEEDVLKNKRNELEAELNMLQEKLDDRYRKKAMLEVKLELTDSINREIDNLNKKISRIKKEIDLLEKKP